MTEIDARSAHSDTAICDVDAEMALLGCVLYEPDAFRLIDGLTGPHFFEHAHQAIWQAVSERVEAGRAVHPTSIWSDLKAHPSLAELGGDQYLANLIDAAPPASSAPELAKVIQDAAIRRELVGFGRAIQHAAADRSLSGFDHLNVAEQALQSLAHSVAPSENNLIDARASAVATLAEIEHEAEHGRAKGLMTGLRCIDRRLRGLKPGSLLVIAGRPSMGKTALARQAAKGCAERNPNTAIVFFALEMHRRELDERTLSEVAYRKGEWIPYQDMTGDKLTPTDRMLLTDLVWKVPRNLIIDDSPVLTVEYVRRRVWAMKRKGPLGAVFIDYLQIMSRPNANGRNEASVIGEMTAALKRLAREAEVCVVLLSQINRGVESREDKRPQLSDLRESGSIEQDANAVLFPFREVYYVERAEPSEPGPKHLAWEQKVEELKRRMDVLCAKNRQGAVGTDRQEYYAEFDAISDIREDAG